MPTYFYRCTACEEVREDDATMAAFKEHHPPCTSCNSSCDYIYIPTVCQVALKDGPSGSWPSKGGRFQDHRAKQSAIMEKRQFDRYGPPKQAISNFEGKETENWREAKEIAIKERGIESGATYDAKIKEENAKKIST